MRIIRAALGAMKEGLSPEKAALGLALGVALGVFPVLGTTTLLCVAAGTALRLNHGLIQSANYAISLVYLPAFYGLVRLGEAVTGRSPLPLSLQALAARITSDPMALFTGLGAVGGYALLGWIVAAPLLAGLTYVVAFVTLRAATRGPWLTRAAPDPSRAFRGRAESPENATLLVGRAGRI